jgi:hypothetical protein
MQTPDTTSIWLSEQAMPFALIVLLLAFVMTVLYLSARNRRTKMNEERSGVNEDTFVSFLSTYGFDANIARSTYRYLQEKQRVSFPIQAADLLDEDLGLDSEDIRESMLDLLSINQRLHQPGVYLSPLVTVEDLVRFVQASPRLSELAA